MKINSILKDNKYDERRGFIDKGNNKHNKRNNTDVQITFSEVLQKVKQVTYSK